MRWAALAALVVPFAAAAATPDQPQRWHAFKAWHTVCDNTLRCVAFAGAEDGGLAWVRIARDAGPDATPSITFAERFETGRTPASRLLAAVGGFHLAAPVKPDETIATSLAGAAAAPAIEAVRDGSTLTIGEGADGASVPLDGAAAALRWIDAQQGRAGTVTALVARGDAAAATVPPAPALPPVAVPRPSPAGGKQRRMPQALRDLPQLRACTRQVTNPVALDAKGDMIDDWRPVAVRLTDTLTLWAVPCELWAYNATSILATEDAAGHVQAAHFPPLRGVTPDRESSDSRLFLDHIDAATGEIFTFDKGRGIGDCGDAATYAWDGRGFRLIGEQAMDPCIGVAPLEWPTVVRTRQH